MLKGWIIKCRLLYDNFILKSILTLTKISWFFWEKKHTWNKKILWIICLYTYVKICNINVWIDKWYELNQHCLIYNKNNGNTLVHPETFQNEYSKYSDKFRSGFTYIDIFFLKSYMKYLSMLKYNIQNYITIDCYCWFVLQITICLWYWDDILSLSGSPGKP